MVETQSQPVTTANGTVAGPMDTRPIAMSVRHVTKYYKTQTGSVHALEDLSLEIAEG